MNTGGFLVPQEFVVDLARVFGLAVLQKHDPDFVLPRLPEYEQLRRKIGRLPHFARRHFPGHDDYDSFMWPSWLPLAAHPFLYQASLLVSRLLFGNLQKQWCEVWKRQHQLQNETVRKALRDLGYPPDDLISLWKQIIESAKQERGESD